MVVFTPVEEVQSNLVAPWGQVEKVARDSFREGWVDDPYTTMSSVDLEEGLVLMEMEEVLEAEGDTLGEAVEIMKETPVVEGEGLIILEQIRKTNVVITERVMVR